MFSICKKNDRLIYHDDGMKIKTSSTIFQKTRYDLDFFQTKMVLIMTDHPIEQPM